MNSSDLPPALLLGAASGLRTFTGLATLAARGRLPVEGRLRTAIIAAAAGELAGDKLPFVPARTQPLPYLGRIAAGGLCGARVRGPRGAAAGAAAAALSTVAGYHARRIASRRAPDLLVALLEDSIAIGAANLAATMTAG